MKIYISGKISDCANYMDNFLKAEQELRNKGYDEVVNPARIMANFPKETRYVEYMAMSLRLLDDCDMIYLLDNFYNSYGARIEYLYALGQGKGVVFQSEEKADGDKIG